MKRPLANKRIFGPFMQIGNNEVTVFFTFRRSVELRKRGDEPITQTKQSIENRIVEAGRENDIPVESAEMSVMLSGTFSQVITDINGFKAVIAGEFDDDDFENFKEDVKRISEEELNATVTNVRFQT